ncbi:MAG: potassium-transporting ATPase subunit B, partial [Luteimonas sp.]|nr:potassium-transporting ATPase subunit B [Luteimonas sp.]
MTDLTYKSKTRADHPALIDAAAFRQASIQSFTKLAPRHLVRSPVMAVVMMGTILSALIAMFGGGNAVFGVAVTVILLVTVLFANFAEAVAEARGRGQASSLR